MVQGKGRKQRHQRNVLQNMHKKFKYGPLSLLLKYKLEKIRIKVWILLLKFIPIGNSVYDFVAIRFTFGMSRKSQVMSLVLSSYSTNIGTWY